MGSLVIFVLAIALLQCAVTVTCQAVDTHPTGKPRLRTPQRFPPIPEHVKPRSGRNSIYVTDHIPFFAFNAAVYHKGTFLCGGALISDDKVLTAAECVHPYIYERPLHTYVELGGIKINSGPERFKITIPVIQIVIHPDFHRYKHRENIYYNNVALLKLEFKLTRSEAIRPMALGAVSDVIVPGKTGTLTGWGGKSNLKPTTELQARYNAIIMDHQACSFAMGTTIDENSFCTVPSNTTTACKYDQGGPLFKFVYDVDRFDDTMSGYVLLGIVNYGPCDITYPTMYTSIPKYVSWINSLP